MFVTYWFMLLLGFAIGQDDDVEFVNCPIVPRVPKFLYRDVSALGVAVLYNATKDLETFLNSGCDVNYDGVYYEKEKTDCHNPVFEILGIKCRRTVRYSGYAPLNLASLHGTVETVERLLKVPGIYVNSTSSYPSTPLTNAAYYGNYEMIKLLVEAGADVNAIEGENFTALYQSADGDIQIVKLLVEAGADVNSLNGQYKVTPLMRASDKEKVDVVEYFISKAVNVNVKTTDNFTALYFATASNNTEIVELLVEAGADVNVQSGESQWSPIIKATYEGYDLIVSYLIYHGADVNARTSGGFTVAFIAVQQNNSRILEMLFEAGADLNIQSESGWSPLMKAVYDGFEDIVTYLINNNADVNAVNSDECSPVFLAVDRQNLPLVKLLVEAGADIDIQCNYDDTSPLMQAAYDGNEEIVAYLKEKGANLTLIDVNGNTALDIAEDQDYKNIVQILDEK